MVYIKTNISNQVIFMHYLPFDEVHGLGKTAEELRQDGFLLDSVPDPEVRANMNPIAYYTPESGYWYEYEKIPAGPATTSDIRSLNAKLDYFMMMQEVV